MKLLPTITILLALLIPGCIDMEQLQDSGRWVPKADLKLEDLEPGMIVVAYRNEVLCVGVLDYTDPATNVTYTIEGEAGAGTLHVAHRTRPLWLPTFVGVGLV